MEIVDHRLIGALHVEVPVSVTGVGDGTDRRDEVAAVEGGG